MARHCQVCNKGVIFGNKVSHSNKKTSRKWIPNLHKTTIVVGSKTAKVKVCTKCLRKIKTEDPKILKRLTFYARGK